MIRVLIAEDQGMLLTALGTLLDLEDDLEVVALAKNGQEALELVRKTAPDIVLTDIEMPVLGGLELAERVRDEQLGSRVIIVTTFARSGYLRRALDAGARGRRHGGGVRVHRLPGVRHRRHVRVGQRHDVDEDGLP